MTDFIEHEKILEENFKLFFQEAQQRFLWVGKRERSIFKSQ
jgi:hypothetical protein